VKDATNAEWFGLVLILVALVLNVTALGLVLVEWRAFMAWWKQDWTVAHWYLALAWVSGVLTSLGKWVAK